MKPLCFPVRPGVSFTDDFPLCALTSFFHNLRLKNKGKNGILEVIVFGGGPGSLLDLSLRAGFCVRRNAGGARVEPHLGERCR